MTKTILKMIIPAMLWIAPHGFAQQILTPQRVEGIWIFRALGLFPGQTQPVFTGAATFRPDGTFTGPENDQHSSGGPGLWIATGNYGEFAFTFLSNTFDSTGNFQSTSRVRGVMTISADGLSATGKAKLEVLDTTGAVTFSSSNTFTGARSVVAPF